MKASVIIPTKNPGIGFKRILDICSEQNTPWNYEILVIDSGSTDGTLDLLKTYPNVNVHCIESKDFGHGSTRNLGISMTSGEFAVFLTHDALPANNKWLFELVNAVEQSDNIAGAFGRHRAYQKDGPYLSRDLEMHFNNFKNASAIVHLEDPKRYQTDVGYRQFLHFFSNCNSCLRRSVWEKIPFPDVDFAEDQAWAKKIIETGYEKAYADNAVVYHSHQYGFWETFIRCFDESRALKKIFGYDLCPNMRHLIMQSVHTVIADVRYSFEAGHAYRDRYWLLQSPLRNFFRQLGFYLGQHANQLPSRLSILISRDNRMKRS